MANEIKFPVFVDNRGNRFVFPGLYSSIEEGKSVDWFFCRKICCALGVTEEKEPLRVEKDEAGVMTFEHVKAEAGGPGFAHGSGNVYLIGGPEFDAIKSETAEAA
jgi:hypothetical protein